MSSFSEIPEVSASPLLHTQRLHRWLSLGLLGSRELPGSRDTRRKYSCDPAGRRLERFGDSGTSCNDRYTYDYDALTPFAAFATDLLVKPFDVERFETALDLATSTIPRARQNLTTIYGTNPLKTTTSGLQFLQRLAAEINEKIVLVRDVWHLRYLQRRTGKKRPRQSGSGQGTLRSRRRFARYRSPDSDGRHRRGNTLGSGP